MSGGERQLPARLRCASTPASSAPGAPRRSSPARYQNYDKFKGPGELEKKQFNAVIRQDFENENFISLAFHYNDNRNAFYRTTSEANFAAYGRDYDNLDTCTRDCADHGVDDNDNAQPGRARTPAPAATPTILPIPRAAPTSTACASIRRTRATSACSRCGTSATTCA